MFPNIPNQVIQRPVIRHVVKTAIGIGFLHEYSLEKAKGAPVELVVPCEGTGYEIGGVSIIKGARNLENAKLFVDWALSKEAQELTWKKGKRILF